MFPRVRRGCVCFCLVFVLALGGIGLGYASDHGDTPLLKESQRHDARLADLFAFVRDGNLVLILTTDPTIPPGVTEYVFPTDVKYRIFIDNDRDVSFDDPADLANFGGTVVAPKRIRADIAFQIRFRDDNTPQLGVKGLTHQEKELISLFTGPRDDPFIRAPREGRNIAAIVLELPLSLVLDSQPTLLIWGTAKVQDLHGSQQELAGRALRSQFPENDQMNTLHPRDHLAQLGVAPDVLILNTSEPSAFPNGHELADDVVDLVCFAPAAECRVFDQANEGPAGPAENDVPFLDVFPYLAPPQG